MHNLMNFHDHFTYDKILKFPNLWNSTISNMAVNTALKLNLRFVCLVYKKQPNGAWFM
jgi:hypothetical protein